MKIKNDIYSISKSKVKQAVFEQCIEEACRQWCIFIDDAPERKNGEGFAQFFYEIFDDKWREYLNNLADDEKYPKSKDNRQER